MVTILDKSCKNCNFWHLGDGCAKPEILCNNPRSLLYDTPTAPDDLCVQHELRMVLVEKEKKGNEENNF